MGRGGKGKGAEPGDPLEDILTCLEEPCMCWGSGIYEPAEDTWLAWKLLERLPKVGGLGVDVGTGSCVLTNVLAKKVDMVIGIDINEMAVKACRKCKVEALLCDSMSCLRRGANVAVANLPYLPCDDDEAVCWKWGLRVLKGIKVVKGGYLVIIWSSLTPQNPLELLKGFETIELVRESYGMEDLYGAVLIKRE